MIHATRLRPNGSPTLFERERSDAAPQTLAEYEALLAGLVTRERGRRGKDVHGLGPRNELVHLERLPEREAAYGELSEPLPEPLRRLLEAQGIHRLYVHQARAIEHARAGAHVAVATGTASGKSLAYHLPILERLLLDREAIALYLFPTKALAQDQLRGLERSREISATLRPILRAGAYDGDTPPSARRRLREEANALLTNPDMLHQGILPYHARWSRVFSNLRYVVVDEMHTYRGIFGSHVANVLRRLRRVARHYGADPRFLLSSATIRNPGEQASLLVGDDVRVVDEDGAPRGPKLFAFWNPMPRDAGTAAGLAGDAPGRASASVEAERILVSLMRRDVQTIAFTKSRVAAELIFRYTRERLERDRGGREGGEGLADRLAPYRGGYLPEERRAIERRLFDGELRGVVATNALELGIDVGTLDAAVLVGFPNTIASTWQQAGRAGRSQGASLAVVVAYDDPIDQYLMRHPEYFFAQSPENAVLDPENPYVLASHLACAAYEIPLSPEDEVLFGTRAPRLSALLEEEGTLTSLDGRRYWAQPDYPAGKVNLRTIGDDTYTILDVKKENAVIATVDAISALELVYPEAIYLHEGNTFFVRELDLEQKLAYVEPREVDYYTQPVLDTRLKLLETRETKRYGEAEIGFGSADVNWATVAMKKIRFRSLDAIGYHPLELPRLNLDTVAFWIRPDEAARTAVRVKGLNPAEGLSGLRNLVITLLPLHVMCDRPDLGGILNSSNLGELALFVYDRYPGGLGYAERGYAIVGELLASALALVEDCPCETGCPSCVGMPVLRPAQQQDYDVNGGWPIPSKAATAALLRRMLGR
ncbi:MAG TPA: DEAD/DEAH box helicase [Candidatus Eisenbacteria bacterium]|nr:DEAD/DEAH box helicase [Candidatus Eisenbacteria bacterium]